MRCWILFCERGPARRGLYGFFMMADIIITASVSVVLAVGVYWYLRFAWVLPVAKKLAENEMLSSRLITFSREMAESLRIPDSKDYLADLVQQTLARFHKIFPESNLLLFEAAGAEGGWKLVNQAGSCGKESSFVPMSVYKGDILDRAAKSGEIVHSDLPFSGGGDPVASLLRSCGVKTVLGCPCLEEGGIPGGVLVMGGFSSIESAQPYIEITCRHLTSLYGMTREILKLKKEEERLRDELGASMQELSMAGTRLIQRARERKALYEVVSTIASKPSSPQGGYSAVLTILAKIMEADIAACLLLDEEKKELVTQAGARGVDEDESIQYRISLNNQASSSVRVFRSRKPFITGDAQNDPDVISHYVKLWNVRSLMVVPIILHDKPIGVLRVGSAKVNYFTQDQLDFLCLIAEELAVIIEAMMLYEKLARTAEELAQLNRLKDEFVSTVSHELKTPLTAIRGFISVILSGEAGELSGQQKKFLGIAERAVNRLNYLISDLLDLSRLDGRVEMEFKPVSIESLLERAAENFLFQAQEKNIQIYLEPGIPLLPVYADPRWIAQVIDNLLGNAVKFTGRGGKIVLSAQEKGDVIMVSLTDNGPGISPVDQEHVFEKFYRAKHKAVDAEPGTGLGLAISKSIVEKHGGKIWVESNIGEGSKFCFVLPVAKAETQARHRNKAKDAETVKKEKKGGVK